MASNVFGKPINNSTLDDMRKYVHKVITSIDTASMALEMKNEGGNDLSVCQYVEKVGKDSPFDITTLCVVYNATGGTLRYVDSHNWHGHISESPCPVVIANGQWGGFVHVKDGGSSFGSHAGVVYCGQNEAGEECDWMMSWRNPYDRHFDNFAYTERSVKKTTFRVALGTLFLGNGKIWNSEGRHLEWMRVLCINWW